MEPRFRVYRVRRSRALHLVHDDPWLCWRWLHGLSPEVKASTNGRLIHDHRVELKSRLRAAFLLAALRRTMSAHGTFETCRPSRWMSAFRGKAEATRTSPKR